jgi:hypothetical protein
MYSIFHIGLVNSQAQNVLKYFKDVFLADLISNETNLIAAELNLQFGEKRLLATPLVFEFLFSEMHQEQKLNILICQKHRFGPI